MEVGNVSVVFSLGIVALIRAKKIHLNHIRAASHVTCWMKKQSELIAEQ